MKSHLSKADVRLNCADPAHVDLFSLTPSRVQTGDSVRSEPAESDGAMPDDDRALCRTFLLNNPSWTAAYRITSSPTTFAFVKSRILMAFENAALKMKTFLLSLTLGCYSALARAQERLAEGSSPMTLS